MKYLLMIYNRPGFLDDLTEAERSELFADVDTIISELTASGELAGGQALAAPTDGRTVRARDGQPTVTDGPFLESKEHFAGTVVVDCASLERATEIAARWPDIRYGGAMEVREIVHDLAD